ncbi:MAG: ABC transporter ATP-binding protein [Roseburia faecis]|jgi:ABC-type multidrug transport system fused ATPase/permease subunit
MKLKKGKNIIENIIWSITELYKFQKKYIGLFWFQAVISGILPIVSLVLIQQIINILQYKTAGIELLIIKLVIMILFRLFCGISLNYLKLAIENLELEFGAYLQAKILKKIAMLDSKDFENSKTYDLINRTRYDGNAGILGTIKILFAFISVLISTISYIAIIANYNIFIFSVIIVLPVIRYFYERKYNLEEYNVSIRNTEMERKSSYISFLLTNSENFKEIKLYQLFAYFIKKFEKIKEKYNFDFIRLHNKRTRTYSIINIFDSIVDCLVMMYILIQTFNGYLLIGDFILYNNSIDSLKENIMSVFTQISYIYKNSAMIEQIRLFFDIQSEDTHEKGIIIDKIDKIELKNVSYRYQEKEQYVLRNISLELCKGEFTVLLGYNGSGKSTLIKIIMGIYSDYEGEIYINKINLKDINLEVYRKKVAVMFQNYIKYESSIRDNIRYGDNRVENDRELYKILDKVTLEDFKDNIEQPLGYQFTDGIQISIGQWQKLALGRTLFKPAEVYIFDEPNASLDIASEQAVLNMIWEEMRDKIAILIIHRFNCMLERADKIIVLENGEIEDIGIHEELLRHHGLYYRLYMVQKEMSLSDE